MPEGSEKERERKLNKCDLEGNLSVFADTRFSVAMHAADWSEKYRIF